MREAADERHHARTLASQMVGIVNGDVDAPRAAGKDEALQPLDARRVVDAQGGEIRIEDAKRAAPLLERAIHRRLEEAARIEALVDRPAQCRLHGSISRVLSLSGCRCA